MDVYSKQWVLDNLYRVEFACNNYHHYMTKYHLFGATDAYHFYMKRRRWLLKELLRIQLRDFNTS